MEPVIVARNVGSAAATLSGRLQVTRSDGEVSVVELSAVTIEPDQTTLVDARAAWGLAAKLTRDEAVGPELEHDTSPGTVVIAAATISQDLSHTFHVPLTDPRTLPSATGGYFWRVEDTRNTLVVLKNMTDEPQRYNLIVRHAQGPSGNI